MRSHLSSAVTLRCLIMSQVVVYVDHCTSKLEDIDAFCHSNGIKFISVESRGLAGSVFCDFGKAFEVCEVESLSPSHGSRSICFEQFLPPPLWVPASSGTQGRPLSAFGRGQCLFWAGTPGNTLCGFGGKQHIVNAHLSLILHSHARQQHFLFPRSHPNTKTIMRFETSQVHSLFYCLFS